MSVSVITRAQKDLAEAPSLDFDLVTPGPEHSLAIRPRRNWYQPTAADLAPLSAQHLEVLRALETFGTAGATETQVSKQLGQDVVPTKQALGQMHPKGLVFRKGSSWYLDRLGKLHLSGTLDAARDH